MLLLAQAEKLSKNLAKIESAVRPALDAEKLAQLVRDSLDRIGELAADLENLPQVCELFRQLDPKLYLKFSKVQKKKRVETKLSGGILALGATKPPIDVYAGPTSRKAVVHSVSETGEEESVQEVSSSGRGRKSLGNVRGAGA